jgi:peptidoglycan/LPS O-acetylase OafA/YrhL
MTSPNTAPTQANLRKDIQGMRAIAVVLVVVFHLWPSALPGGFVGVDAFFVISGFLISAHLRREIEATGRIQLAEFWARRARRLLPASLLVLAVCLLVTVLVVPLSLWSKSIKDITAASAYVVNWALAFDAVDYSAAEAKASPVQHFWSLSVEEQFYLVWPLLLGFAASLGKRHAKALNYIRWLLLALVLGSFTLSALSTLAYEPQHYFVTWNRIWEFGAGALLAFVDAPRLSARIGSALGLAGALVLCAAAFLIHGRMPFPGVIAILPVVGTLTALQFGEGAERWALGRVLNLRAIQWLGDASYGIYLWHWPLIVFLAELPEGFGRTNLARGLVIPVTFILAALSKRYVEDAVRFRSVFARRPPRTTFYAVFAAMGVLIGLGTLINLNAKRLTGSQRALTASMRKGPLPCFGANRSRRCVNSEVEGRLFPSPSAAKSDHAFHCMANNQGDTHLKVCNKGAKHAKVATAIVGDSHAAHFSPVFEFGAKSRNEAVLQMMKGSCPFSMSERDSSPQLRKSCEAFKKKIWKELESRKDVRRVVLSASSLNALVTKVGMDSFGSAVLGYEEMFQALPPHVTEVLVFRDVPRPRADVVECLERLPNDAARLAYGACARPRSEALLPDPLAEAARRVGGRVHLVDFTDVFCDDRICSPVVGNVLVYRDGHHLTKTFALSLVPRLQAELKAEGLEPIWEPKKARKGR